MYPHIDELSKTLNRHFNWNKAKMDCFVGMLIGLLKTTSMNLADIAAGFASDVKPESRYRRIQRFIHGQHIDFNAVAWFVMVLFGFNQGSHWLVMDRTNWKWGKKNINILMLAVVYKGVAIPIYWLLLNKKGNSSTRERIALMKRCIKKFGEGNGRIQGLMADREFVGKEWLSWLKAEGIDFRIRIKKNAKVIGGQGEALQVQQLFWNLGAGEARTLPGPKTVTGVGVYLSCLRLADGELLIVASGNPAPDAIESYGKRWQIETLFGCLKGRGFDLEDTRVTDRTRIKRLLAVAVVAFCWAHRTGEWQHENVKPIKVKKHQRLAKSLFRAGLDWLNDTLLKAVDSLLIICRDFLQFIDFEAVCPAN